MVKVCVALLIGFLWAVAPTLAVASPPPAASPSAGGGGSAWKQIYEDSQTVYYIGAASPPQTGRSEVQTLQEFKIPQVVNGAQVWSIVSRMQLSCDQRQMITVDDTLYALRMGAGPVVQLRAANDGWHQPEPGTLGGLVWSTACGKQ